MSSLTGAGLAGADLTFARAEETSSVRSGPGGRFRFDARVAGRWSLAAATAPGYLPFAPEWGQSPIVIVTRAGEVVRGVSVALAPAEEYEGRAVDEGGAPVPGAEITIAGGGTGSTTLVPAQAHLVTDAAGAFRFRAPEEAVIEARRAGFAPGRARVDYAVRVSRKLQLTLRRTAEPLRAIEGTVEDPSGAPAVAALVSARPKAEPGAAPALARADDAGHFAVGELGPGAWVLTAARAGTASATAEAAAGAKGVVLRLTAGGRVAGCVRERGSGRPVATFTVFVRGAGEPRRESVIDGAGCYEVAGVAPGAVDVGVVAPGFAPPRELRVLVPDASSGPARAEFELSPGGSVSGVVVDRVTREPLPHARIGVEGTEASLGVPIRNETLADEAGRFRLGGLSEETLGLFATAEGHHARLVALPRAAEGEQVGPVTVDLAPVAPGEDPKLELAGIGAKLGKQGDSLIVNDVIAGGGAAAAGLGPGDAIVAIEGRPVGPMSFTEAIQLLRGPEGTTVTVSLVKAGAGAASTVLVPRQRILN